MLGLIVGVDCRDNLDIKVGPKKKQQRHAGLRPSRTLACIDRPVTRLRSKPLVRCSNQGVFASAASLTPTCDADSKRKRTARLCDGQGATVKRLGAAESGSP